MDPGLTSMLEGNERAVWHGFVSRKVLTTLLIIFLGITFLISGFLFMQKTIAYTSNGQPKETSGFMIGIVVLPIGLVISLISYFSDFVKEYAITNKRVLIKSGLIGTDFKSIYFDQIKNAEVKVDLIGKLFGVGSILIDIGKTETYSSGGGKFGRGQIRTKTMYDILKHIDAPYEVYKYLHKTLEGRKESLYSGRADMESNPEYYSKK